MTGTVTKGLALREDLDLYDGLTLTGERADSSGGTLTGLRINDDVDVLAVYGDAQLYTVSTINSAMAALGTQNVALRFAPGTWTIDSNTTFPANFTIVVAAGAVFNISTGVVLTINGTLIRQHTTWISGGGSIAVNGFDSLASTSLYADYAADTGSADTYTIAPSPAIGGYATGQRFRFKAANTNTGASTLNVNSQGAKTIKKDRTDDLEAGDITADDIVTVQYDGTNFQFTHTRNSLDFVDDVLTTRGDTIYRDASGAQRLAVGTAREVFTSDGTDPAWQNAQWEYVDSVTVSAATWAEVIGINTNGYRHLFVLENLDNSATASGIYQVSDDGGSSWKSASNAYAYSNLTQINAASPTGTGGLLSDGVWCASSLTPGTYFARFELVLSDCNGGVSVQPRTISFTERYSGAALAMDWSTSLYTAVLDVDAIRFGMGSGTITVDVHVFRQKLGAPA